MELLKRATSPDFGFLYIVFGLKIKFFNSYKSEFKIKDDDAKISPYNKGNAERSEVDET